MGYVIISNENQIIEGTDEFLNYFENHPEHSLHGKNLEFDILDYNTDNLDTIQVS
jgi:hypothetical protein